MRRAGCTTEGSRTWAAASREAVMSSGDSSMRLLVIVQSPGRALFGVMDCREGTTDQMHLGGSRAELTRCLLTAIGVGQLINAPSQTHTVAQDVLPHLADS